MWRSAIAVALLLSSGALLVAGDDAGRRAFLKDEKFKNTNRDPRRALERGDLIVEVDGATGHTRSTYLAYLMREKKPGSRVELRVLRNGRSVRVSFTIPAKRPEVLGH